MAAAEDECKLSLPVSNTFLTCLVEAEEERKRQEDEPVILGDLPMTKITKKSKTPKVLSF
jgi:hypothetical protein